MNLTLSAIAICQFARVFHVRDFCCAYAVSDISLLASFTYHKAACGRVKGRRPLRLSGVKSPAEGSAGGQLWGAAPGAPLKSGYRVSEANEPLTTSFCAASAAERCVYRARLARVMRDIAERKSI